MEVRIHLPRPLLTFSLIVVSLLWWNGILSFHAPAQQVEADANGGQSPKEVLHQAAQDIDRERVKQAVLERQEEILRYNFEILEQQALQTKTPEDVQRVKQAREVLLSIARERGSSEKLLSLSLSQLWEAEGTVFSTKERMGDIVLLWPVKPTLGISAHFEDSGYEKRFGFPHHAIDIPTAQGSPIHAPVEGVVAAVRLNGLGYSSIVLEHADGLQTIYGHITDAVVSVGSRVASGQVIGHTGGQPGTLGAGLTTTGPHLHFAVRKNGALVDPLQFLPSMNR